MSRNPLTRLTGSHNERALLSLWPKVELINSLEQQVQQLSDSQLQAKTAEFRQRLNSGQTMDEILPEAFSVVREAARRTVNMRHFDIQLMGGIVLHQGRIAEMATGEGKTLVATLAVYLNALTGKGVHVVTVNDYLARRDRNWMGPIYDFLGISCGAIQHDMHPGERKKAYQCDVTYGTNNEFGFDYLRDNMVTRIEHRAQRPLHYAIVDEVDSILIDEARTPLIISGPAEESTDKYYKVDKIIPFLKKGSRNDTTKEETGDFVIDEKNRTTYLTEAGEVKAAGLLNLDDLHGFETMEYKHHINQALRARYNFKHDVDYMIKDGQIVIVDEFTGRMMPGRRWGDGLHQAIEAKEKVVIKRENQTLATVTFQNYFRMYEKLAGMTGTASTEAMEFSQIYKLDVVVIPTNKLLLRTNYSDVIYKTEKEKFKAVVDEIEDLYRRKRPVLVGTISINKSERLSRLLKDRNISCNVLNAKYHEREAHIIAQAGRLGAVTLATNMAGRGTDILLGGNAEAQARDIIEKQISSGRSLSEEEKERILSRIKQEVSQEHQQVIKLGGLHIIGTERHEARRIDNQLRGRAGRQGDPGSSRFYLSLQDDLMRIFGSDRIAGIMDKLGMEEGQEIQHPIVTTAIGTAQKRVETMNFDIRKHLLEFDNVMNSQRETIYKERRIFLEGENLKNHILDMIDDILTGALEMHTNPDVHRQEWDLNGLRQWLRLKFPIQIDDLKLENLSYEEIKKELLDKAVNAYNRKEDSITAEVLRYLEKVVLLQILDSKWKEHLYSLDVLREGIGLRAYGQRDPLVEYRHEAYRMFSDMIESIKTETIEVMFKVQPVPEERKIRTFSARDQKLLHPEAKSMSKLPQDREVPDSLPGESMTPYRREGRKIGRNEPCPCGSGKKYKHCCGKSAG
ncbi:MAG: preprotein translocase subunit SecA [Candidatus Omnitrophota bacterium]|nr:preprotein translocase subunit SecA [Candidatus Omnitrophota bacterium]